MTRKSKRATEDGDEDGLWKSAIPGSGKRTTQDLTSHLNRLLDTTVFLSLKDLGLALPHYAEEVSDAHDDG